MGTHYEIKGRKEGTGEWSLYTKMNDISLAHHFAEEAINSTSSIVNYNAVEINEVVEKRRLIKRIEIGKEGRIHQVSTEGGN